MKKLLLAITLSAGMLSATGANAALTSTLGGQGVYDTDLNITWLANANLAASNTFGVAGIVPVGYATVGYMSWYTAQSWIGAMNAANYLGFNDWRLPTTLQPDASCGSQSGGISSGPNCTGSEMGHLFYNELGGVAGYRIDGTHNANYGLFQNLQSGHYWSSTEYAPYTGGAWYFGMGGGPQTAANKYAAMLAWAVRPGQSVVAAVPEPETYAMLLAGLGLLGFTARRRKGVSRQAA